MRSPCSVTFIAIDWLLRCIYPDPDPEGEDVLDRRNFDTFSGAIQNLCKKEKSSEEKSGLKLALGCTLKKTIRVMKGYYTQINDTDSH